MTLQLTLIGALWFVGASALLLLATVWQRGHWRRRPWLLYLALASALYAIGYGLELAGDNVRWVLATFYVQHPAIAFAPTIILLAAIDLGRVHRRVARPLLLASLVIASITVALVYTNPLHDLYHANPRMEAAGPLTLIAFDPGPWYVVFHVTAGATLLLVNAILVRTWKRAPAGTHERAQAATVAAASLIPWFGSLVYLAGVLPLPLDLTPATLAFTTGLIYLGVTRYDLADPAPIARDLIFERMHDPVFVLDADDHLIDLNRAAARLVEPLEAARGRHLSDALGADVLAAAARSPSETVVDGRPLELAGRTFDARIAQLRDRRGHRLGRAVVLRDVSDYARLQHLLTHLANTDELTGLANRRRFIDLTERALARASHDRRPISLAIFDLDQFKRVNDTHGHQAGDALLRAIATTVGARLRPTDLIGRYGGEEFAACLPDTGADAARSVGERLRAAVAETTIALGGEHAVGTTASVGVCAIDPGDQRISLETLLARADAAQYEAKRLGGDRVIVVTLPG